jgi:hypothetical protein
MRPVRLHSFALQSTSKRYGGTTTRTFESEHSRLATLSYGRSKPPRTCTSWRHPRKGPTSSQKSSTQDTTSSWMMSARSTPTPRTLSSYVDSILSPSSQTYTKPPIITNSQTNPLSWKDHRQEWPQQNKVKGREQRSNSRARVRLALPSFTSLISLTIFSCPICKHSSLSRAVTREATTPICPLQTESNHFWTATLKSYNS